MVENIENTQLVKTDEQQLLDFWKEHHKVELTVEQLLVLKEYQKELNKKRLENLKKFGITDYSNLVHQKKALGAVVFGAIGFVVGGWAGVVAVGLSIWQRSRRKNQAQEERENAERNTPSAYGIDQTAEVTRLGGVIPLVYCSRSINPTGGFRVGGELINSRGETWLGSQTIYSLQSLCLGPVGAIDINTVRVNDNPRWNYYQTEIENQWRSGIENQSAINWFPNYSRAITPSSNTSLGIDKRGEVQQVVASNLIIVGKDDFDNFSPDHIYYARGYQFTITEKNSSDYSITISQSVDLPKGEPIYVMYTATYETQDACDELEFHLKGSAWARDENNVLRKHGYAWDVYLAPYGRPFVRIIRLYVSNKAQAVFRRSFKLRNLPYRKHTVHLVPLTATGGVPVYKLGDVGKKRTIDTGISYETGNILVDVEQNLNHRQEDGSTNRNISYNNKKTASSDSEAPLRITLVNEITNPWSLGQPKMSGYNRLALLASKVKASERLQSSPKISVVITEGLILRFLRKAGSAQTNSVGNTLRDLTQSFNAGTFPVAPGNYYVTNLRNNYTGRVISASGNQVVADKGMHWETGDDYIIWNWQSSCYLPDIAADLLINPEYGRGSDIDWRTDIDFPSFVRSKEFCAVNKLYWDGIIDRPIPWKQFVYDEAVSCLLYPATIDNKNALIPEQSQAAVALFHSGNILEFRQETINDEDVNTLIIVFRDGSDTLFKEKTVLVQTTAAYFGSVRAIEETLELKKCSGVAQAVRIGQVYLKQRIVSKERIVIRVGLEAARLRPGDVFIASHRLVERGADISGYVMNSSRTGSTEILQLSAPLKSGVQTNTHQVALKNPETGQVTTGIRGDTIIQEGVDKLRLYNVPWALSPPAKNRMGDSLILSANPKYYRTVKIVPRLSDMTIEISGDLWNAEILSTNGLRTVY